MNLLYIYPEELPSQAARSVSVVNTADELSKLCTVYLAIPLEHSLSDSEIFKFYNLKDTKIKVLRFKKSFLGLTSNKFFNKKLSKYILKSNIDIVYVRHLKTAAYLLDNNKNTKLIFECHEIFSKDNIKLANKEKDIYRLSSGLVFINKTLEKEIDNHFELSPNRKVIHNGTGFTLEYKEKEFENIKDIHYIGNFYKWKGVEFLITSMKYFKNLNLRIIGKGKEKEELDLLVNLLGLKNIEFLGFKKTEEVLETLKQSQLTVIPNIPSKYSKYSSPIKLYEYMGTSNIVIAADMDTIKEVVIDGYNGFLFKSGDLESFKKTLQRVISLSNGELQAIAYNAYETSKTFTWEKRAKSIVEFSKDLLT